MDKVREEFESEMRSAGMFENGGVAMERCQESGGYANQDTNAMWSGFIAGWVRSRATLRVELPQQWFSREYDYEIMSAVDVIESLENEGVKYK